MTSARIRLTAALLSAAVLAGCEFGIPHAQTEYGFFASSVRLSYALDLPKSGSAPFPVVIFGHGSGPDTKNEKNAWAERLTEQGFATFRFDKRGVGDSEGEYRRGYADFEALSSDLVAAVEFVRAEDRIDPARIGLMGSSQAGWLIPMVATRAPAVDFAVILSGPTVTVAEHNFWANEAADEDLSVDELEVRLSAFEPGEGDFDPRGFIEAMQVPALWLLGREDRIIPSVRSAAIVREIAASSGQPFSVIVYPATDHGLRDAETGDRIDYWPDLLAWLGDGSAPGADSP